MTQSRPQTYDWYDEGDAREAPRAKARSLPGRPDVWQQFSWWSAGCVFSVLWMLDGWKAAFPGQIHARSLAESLWALLLSLGICYGIFHFSKAQSRPLAHLLCVVSAVVLLLNQAFGA